ncbi:MAG: hypothetical protein ACYSVY_24380, partial [Planctomycetota bacterium]
MARRRYQVLIYDSTGGSVEYTLPNDWLSVASEVGGQTIRPLEARAESRPWQVRISDRGEQFSKLIADSGGQMVMLRRLVALQTAIEGSTYTNMAWGRVSELQDDVESWTVTVDDELLIAREAEIFTDMRPLGSGSTAKYAGTRIFPPGIDGTYRKWHIQQPVSRGGQMARQGVLSTDGNLVEIDMDACSLLGWPQSESQLTPNIQTLLTEDLKPELDFSNTATAGNFNTLRCRIKLDASSSGTDYEIQSFNLGNGIRADNSDKLTAFYNFYRFLGHHDFYIGAWVVWSTSTGPTIASATVHAPGHEPTEYLPLHIGGGEDLFSGQATTAEGYHPFSLVKDIYDELNVRYSTDIQNLIDNTDYGRQWWRITGKANAFEWLTEHIYRPNGVVPFTGNDGKLQHRSIRVPRSTDVNDDITSIPLFDASNSAWPHPGARQMQDAMATRINFTWLNEQHLDKPFEWLSEEVDWQTYGQDGIRAAPMLVTRDYDRIAQLGIKEIDVPLHGIHAWVDNSNFLDARRAVEAVKRDIFERYGDGALSGTLTPLTTAVAVVPGSFYRLNIPTVFTPNSQGRGGTMVVQALSVSENPDGQKMEWLWAGPALSPLVTPGIALAAATSDPKHGAKLTVSSLSSGNVWEARV